VSPPRAEQTARIDLALSEWRQGDATLNSDLFMVHLADKCAPLTTQAWERASEVPVDYNLFEVLTRVPGLAVVTQSCDIVKPCTQYEYVEVSPLIKIENENHFQEIRKCQRPSFAYLPGLAEYRMVIDLERTMTVEKAVVVGWNRIPGCTTDNERATLADALARKRQRFAFPHGFNTGLRKFRDRIKSKEGRATAEGQLIEGLYQIRIQAIPNWDAERVTVFFWFLLDAGTAVDFGASSKIIENWLKLTTLTNQFALADPAFLLVTPQDMTVQDFLNSQPLDYDDVSP
jgi:hypothetical protein